MLLCNGYPLDEQAAFYTYRKVMTGVQVHRYVAQATPPSARPTYRRLAQTPPDLVVKFQPVDIVGFILWRVLRLRVVYQREIKG